MACKWVVFSICGRELLRYSLSGESEGEREDTIAILAYETGFPKEEIEVDII